MTNPNPWQHRRNPSLADDIDFEIKGQELQFVEIELDPGESAVAEAGALVWKDADVGMTTVFGDASGTGDEGCCGCGTRQARMNHRALPRAQGADYVDSPAPGASRKSADLRASRQRR